jgi:hypothetical protein
MHKSFSYLFGAIIFFLILLIFQYKLAVYLIWLTIPELALDPDITATDRYIRSHSIVVYGGLGIVLFYLLCALESFLLDSNLNLPRLLKFSRLITLLIRWASVFVLGDIVLQNLGGHHATLWNYTMRIRTIAALSSLELCAFLGFLSAQKASSC